MSCFCGEPVGNSETVAHLCRAKTRGQRKRHRECGSVFHVQCLQRWIVEQWFVHRKMATCPVCRGDLTDLCKDHGWIVGLRSVPGLSQVDEKLLEFALSHDWLFLPPVASARLEHIGCEFLRTLYARHAKEHLEGLPLWRRTRTISRYTVSIFQGRYGTLGLAVDFFHVLGRVYVSLQISLSVSREIASVYDFSDFLGCPSNESLVTVMLRSLDFAGHCTTMLSRRPLTKRINVTLRAGLARNILKRYQHEDDVRELVGILKFD